MIRSFVIHPKEILLYIPKFNQCTGFSITEFIAVLSPIQVYFDSQETE